MINKQSVWFVTLFSLILVLSIYYVTMKDSSLEKIIENATTENTSVPVNVNVEESSLLVSLRVEEDEEVAIAVFDKYYDLLEEAQRIQHYKIPLQLELDLSPVQHTLYHYLLHI